MVERNFSDLSPQEALSPRSILTSSSEALSHLRDLTEQELSAMEQWCAHLPIEGAVRDRLAEIVNQVSALRMGR